MNIVWINHLHISNQNRSDFYLFTFVPDIKIKTLLKTNSIFALVFKVYSIIKRVLIKNGTFNKEIMSENALLKLYLR